MSIRVQDFKLTIIDSLGELPISIPVEA